MATELTPKRAALLRDVINHWIETTAEEDQIALLKEALGLDDSDESFDIATSTWYNAYEALNDIATQS